MKAKLRTQLVLVEDVVFLVGPLNENPYPENSAEWHCFIDVSTSVGVEVDSSKKLSLKTMMREYDQTVEYYLEHLPTLEEDGILKQIE